eukprot:541624-Pelagomonas_calceolata.AAC.1
MSVIVQGRGHFLAGGACPILEGIARSPISSDAKLAGGGEILLCKPSALAVWNALWRTPKRSGVIIPTHLPSVLLASGLLNPCLSRLERARSAV